MILIFSKIKWLGSKVKRESLRRNVLKLHYLKTKMNLTHTILLHIVYCSDNYSSHSGENIIVSHCVKPSWKLKFHDFIFNDFVFNFSIRASSLQCGPVATQSLQ